MTSTPDSNKVFLPGLLLKLHHDQKTGIVTIKGEHHVIRIFLRDGHVIYADGIDKELQLIKEIASKKNLTQRQIEGLLHIKDKDAQNLGKVLIERKLIPFPVWNRFLELKVKQHLTAAIQMETAALGFSEIQLDILPINVLDRNIVQLLLDALRGLKKLEFFKEYIPGDNNIFTLSGMAEELKSRIPLNPSEQMILSLVDGKISVGDIIGKTGLKQAKVYQIL